MSKTDYRNIEKVQGKCGGRAVVAGTRIRVSLIWQLVRDGMTVDEILGHYSHLRAADVYDALAYAHDHLAEIESDIADDDEETVQRKFPGELDDSRVIVTFVPAHGSVDLSAREVDETQAAGLRCRLQAFSEEWDRPEMGAYDAL